MPPASHNLLLLISNLGLGGAQRVFHDHSVELAKHYTVTEAVFNLDGGDMYPSGNEVRSLEVAGGGSPVDKIRNFGRRIGRLRALKRRLHTDVCVSHLEGADYVNLLSKGPEKVVLCIHGSKLHDGNITGLVGWLRKKVLMPGLYNRADKIVTVSRDINPELIEGFGVKPEKLITINNFFEVAQIEEKSREALTPQEQAVYDSAPVLVTSGRLTIQKNQAPLLDSFAALIKRCSAKLVFVGDGELRDDLIRHAIQLGLRVYEAWSGAILTTEYDVYFLGLQQNPFKYIRPASLFVFPSAWEGFPMALGEAMICGVPAVTTDCPTGPREILAPSTATPQTPIRAAERAEFGMLMPMLNQPASLAADQRVWTETLYQLLGDTAERERLGQLASQRMQDFTREKIFRQWVSVLEEVLAK
ncbi:glycosyltransferase [Hymenobacter psychrophilus]|uniref:Glycosyltransferase involved in cell wall bisynthesis n=1 Tax=Hymenobacter psychrophilus TaxID=651662 RepID=A0A1H3H7I5_9BACT|nr:glycosyltransferase [Hymenobacter psychrophilus]SDY11175.1 Glycosyltransferase involved in cell wall bisynthesis [Hymenobacter psychrophilus]